MLAHQRRDHRSRSGIIGQFHADQDRALQLIARRIAQRNRAFSAIAELGRNHMP